MEKDNNGSTTYCHSCGRNILTSNFLLHEGRCQRMSELRSSRVSQNSYKKILQHDNEQQIKFQQPRRQPYSYPNMNIKQKISGMKKTPLKTSEIQQRIPCPFCGYSQTLAQLDSHPNNCEHREIQCNFCNAKYPRSLMEDHKEICQRNPINISRNNRNNQNRMRRNNQHYGQFESDDQDSHPMIFSNRSRNMYNPSQLMDIFNQPFFNQRSSLDMQPNRGQNFQQQIIRFSNGNRPQVIFRTNSTNPTTFIQLIQMLARRANPNQNPGLTSQQLSKLPKVKYHKKNPQPDLCTICYCEFQENEEIIELSCKHLFHQECIFQWLKRVSTCPVCKKKLKQRHQQQEEYEDFEDNGYQHQNYSSSNDNRGNQGGGFFNNFFGFR